jgi:hypothetical protein
MSSKKEVFDIILYVSSLYKCLNGSRGLLNIWYLRLFAHYEGAL